jgi:hypothetical protein
MIKYNKKKINNLNNLMYNGGSMNVWRTIYPLFVDWGQPGRGIEP